jgi:hypothetical protein
MYPKGALFIGLACLAFPFVVYGFILTAPIAVPTAAPVPRSPYYHEPPMDTSAVVDIFLPVRYTILSLIVVAIVVAAAVRLVEIVQSPPIVAPNVLCQRKQLEALHPAWYR